MPTRYLIHEAPKSDIMDIGSMFVRAWTFPNEPLLKDIRHVLKLKPIAAPETEMDAALPLEDLDDVDDLAEGPEGEEAVEGGVQNSDRDARSWLAPTLGSNGFRSSTFFLKPTFSQKDSPPQSDQDNRGDLADGGTDRTALVQEIEGKVLKSLLSIRHPLKNDSPQADQCTNERKQ